MSQSADRHARARRFRPGLDSLEARVVPAVHPSAALSAAAARPLAKPAQQADSRLSVHNVTVLYTPSGERLAVLTVTRSGGTTGPASVKYQTEEGSAKAGVDFASASGTLYFTAGQTASWIPVRVLHPETELGETEFQVNLYDPVNVGPASRNAAVVIRNSPNTPFDTRPTIKPIDINPLAKTDTEKIQSFVNWRSTRSIKRAPPRSPCNRGCRRLEYPSSPDSYIGGSSLNIYSSSGLGANTRSRR